MSGREKPPRQPVSAMQLFLIIWGPVALIWIALAIRGESIRAQAQHAQINAEYNAMIARQALENEMSAAGR